MKPVYISWTKGVTGAEGRAVIDGIFDVIKATRIPREVKVFGSDSWAAGDYGCPDWYQDRARKLRRFGSVSVEQVGIYQLHWRLAEEPWQKGEPHSDILVVDEDIFDDLDPNSNFLFGAALMDNYVQSVHQFRHSEPDETIRLKLIRRTARHEFGHTYGLPRIGRGNTEERLGPHCTNVCSMRQGVSVGQWRQLHLEEENAGVVFCQQCLGDLQSVRQD